MPYCSQAWAGTRPARIFLDGLPRVASFLAYLVVFAVWGDLLTKRTSAWIVAAAQWPGMAARVAGPPEPVRIRPIEPCNVGSVLGLTILPAVVVAAVLDPIDLPSAFSDPRGFGGWLAWSFFAFFFLALAAAGVAMLVWFLTSLRDVWRSLRGVAYLEVDRDGVRLPIRNLRVAWDNVEEVTAGPEDEPAGFGLRLRDPRLVWSSERLPLWRRLSGRFPDPPEMVLIRISEAREDLFPAYQAALAFHAAHLAEAAGEGRAAEAARRD